MLELIVYGLRPSKNRQVDVHYERRVTHKAVSNVRRSQNELTHTRYDLSTGGMSGQKPSSPFRASRLVVASIGAIDSIVEPECKLNFRGRVSKYASALQLPKASRQMLEAVIVATPTPPRPQKVAMLSVAVAHP